MPNRNPFVIDRSKVLMLVLVSLVALGSCGKRSENRSDRESDPPEVAVLSEERTAEEGRSAEPEAAVPEPAPRVERSRQEPKAPDFTLENVRTGQTVRLADFRGKVLLIDFWATWCGPCRMAIPHLIDLHQEYADRGFSVLGVSLDQHGPAYVRAFVESNGIPYPVVMGDQTTVDRYGSIRSIPTAFLVDREGHVVGRYEGFRQKSFFEQRIEQLLAAEPVS